MTDEQQAAESSGETFSVDSEQTKGTATTLVVTAPQSANTASGRIQAFRDIRRELEQADLSNPGVQKLLLDWLDRSMAECEDLASYKERFHDADKQSAYSMRN